MLPGFTCGICQFLGMIFTSFQSISMYEVQQFNILFWYKYLGHPLGY